jgi:hypothetical protein
MDNAIATSVAGMILFTIPVSYAQDAGGEFVEKIVTSVIKDIIGIIISGSNMVGMQNSDPNDGLSSKSGTVFDFGDNFSQSAKCQHPSQLTTA